MPRADPSTTPPTATIPATFPSGSMAREFRLPCRAPTSDPHANHIGARPMSDLDIRTVGAVGDSLGAAAAAPGDPTDEAS